jgi:predicted dehydrogenase
LELAAISTSRPEEARSFCGPDVALFSDYRDMLRGAELQAVVVCVPTFLHEQYVLEALSRGLPVLCEKPFSLDVASAERMLEGAGASQVCLMIAQVLRFWPPYVRIKQLVDAGAIGSVQVITASRLAMYPPWGDWFRDPLKSGGALLDMQVHDADFIYWLMGPPSEIYAAGLQSGAGSWDQVTTLLRYPKAVATVESTYLLPSSWPFTCGIRVTGTRGCLEFSFRVAGNVEKREQATSSLLLYTNEGAPTELTVSKDDMYAAQLQYFAHCVEHKHSPDSCPPEETLEVMRIMTACQQSLSTSAPVRL